MTTSKRYNKKKHILKKMKGGSKIRISYEEIQVIVKKAFEKIEKTGVVAQKAVIHAIILETLNVIFSDSRTSQLAYLGSSIIGSIFQFAITSLSLTASVTGSMTGTIVSNVSGVSSGILSSLVNTVTNTVSLCQSNPIPATAALSAMTTATVLKANQIKDGMKFTIDNGLLNTITYILFDLMIRSGYFEDTGYSPLTIEDLKPNEDLDTVVSEIVEVASQSSSKVSSSQGSQASQGSQEITFSEDMLNVPENVTLDFATSMVDDMFLEIAQLAKKRSRDIDNFLNDIQSDAEEHSSDCERPSKKQRQNKSKSDTESDYSDVEYTEGNIGEEKVGGKTRRKRNRKSRKTRKTRNKKSRKTRKTRK
jgi:hypothetical protein